ncbi:FG-GAP-like repeat-containing protein [Streptomyces sp. NPDC059070]|uniref:FG-GAP-like repeat-containing protein n=1 Tax=Streptomyces sp. NPDC059070 TaxID=3346713 RepID=UPI0036ABDAB6
MKPSLARIRAVGRPRRRVPAFTTAVALAAGALGLSLGPSASADVTQPPSGTESNKAVAEAKRTGTSVEIVGRRTETDDVWANPDGSLTANRSLVPVRVYRSGELVPVDTTLTQVKGGQLAPKAARVDVTFSGGGDAPLAVMTRNGRKIALTWPKKLPKPTVNGNSAVYPEVLPGVDLRVAAEVDSFSHALIVKTRAAASNPGLAALNFGLQGDGLTVHAEKDGQLRATDPAGQTVFGAVKPQMWDAGGEKAAASANGAKPLRASAASAPVDGITTGTKQADLGVKLTGETLTLTPDQGMLTDPGTKFPVVIDPEWDAWKSAWTIAYKNDAFPSSAGTNYWNGGTLKKEGRVGCARDAENGNAVTCAKTFFQVGKMSDYWGKDILDATLRIKQTRAGSWSCKSGDVQVWDTGSISTATTWNNQPNWTRMVDTSGQSYGGRNCPGDGDLVELNVKSAISDAARLHWGNWTFGLKAAKDTVDVSWRRFDPDSARISIRFNTAPTVDPGSLSTDPSVACSGGTIGVTDQVVLRARVRDKEDNSLTADFRYWKEGGSRTPVRVRVTSGNVAQARIPIPKDLQGNTTYGWDMRVDDGTTASRWTDGCVFTIDKTAPREPQVSSKEYPEGYSDNPTTARTTGKFTLSPNNTSDVTAYRWWTDADPKENEVKPAKAGGAVDITYTPTTAGPQYLYVRSVDAAGNWSTRKEYLFYTKRLPDRDKPGDLNGDGNVDIWSVDPGSGALWMHPGKGDGSFDVSRRLDNGSFADTTALTHHGSWDGSDFYEDLVALQPSGDDTSRKTIYVYENDGKGGLAPLPDSKHELQVAEPKMDHWSQADQVLAIGSVNGDDHPDLLVKAGDQLWLYLASEDYMLDSFTEPIPLGNADWKNMTLMAPGDLNADGLPEIWARDKDSGKVHQYTSRKTTDPTSPIFADLEVYRDPKVRESAIGTKFPATDLPHLASNGDFEGDRYPDLWSWDGDGRITEFPGRPLTDGSVFGAGRQLAVGGTSWSECETFESSATGKHTLCGPILAKYRAKGGTKWAYPTTDVLTTDDKTGRYVNLRGPGGDSDNGSIYWHPSTGAWVVWGSIRNKWISLGAEKGFLGYPTSDETVTFDRDGWVSTFSGSGGRGAIYWAPGIGARSIHGTIYEKYLSLEGPSDFLGYPTTDETNTTDGMGRYNHFRRKSDTADTGSIYWTSTTHQAWSVHGTIRNKWLALGAEKSTLGYPMSDEYDVFGGPREDFQKGYIRHNSTTRISVEHQFTDRTAHLRTDLAGDFNGDGRKDLATVYDYENETTALYVLLAKADGGYEAPTPWWTSGKGNFAANAAKWMTGDYNGDGKTDIGAMYGYANGTNALWTFLANAETKTFREAKNASSGDYEWAKAAPVTGDFNGDGRADIGMAYDYGNGSIGTWSWFSKADGTFTPPVAGWRSEANYWWWSRAKYAAGDINGDGRDDILALYGYSAGGVGMHTALADPEGKFTRPAVSWTQPAGAWDYARTQLTVGDYNGDHRDDAALMYDYGDGKVKLFTLLGKKDGGVEQAVSSWESPDGYWYPDKAGQLASGDSDGDGRDDISVIYNYYVGGSGAMTFKSRTDGGFENPYLSWQAAPGTW